MDYEYLRKYLKEHHITRKQFADDMGVSVYTVNNWFGRKPTNFPLAKTLEISRLYRIPLSKLEKDWLLTIQTENGETKDYPTSENLLDPGESLISCPSNRTLLLHYFDLLNKAAQEKVGEYAFLLTRIIDNLADPEQEVDDDRFIWNDEEGDS